MIFIIQVFASIIALISGECIQDDNSVNLFFLSNDKLWKLEINDTKTHQELISETYNVIDYDFDYIKNRLTWIDDKGRISFRHFDNQSSDEFVYEFFPTLLSTRIAFDSDSEKLYVNEGNYSKLWVIDSKSKSRSAMFDCESLKKKHSINEQVKKVVLDTKAGFFFVMTETKEIKNIYLFKTDGTFKKLIISSKDVVHFDIDRENKRIFWDDAENNNIVSADYEGYNRLNVMKMEKLEPFAVHGNKLFWPSFEFGLHPKYSIEMCILCNYICEKSIIRRIQLDKLREKPYSLKIKRPIDANNHYIVRH